MNALPCLGHADLFDTVLYEEDVPAAERAQAVHRAAALCAACPAPCDQKVTADSGPRELVLLAPDWMPPAREGKPEEVPPPRRTWSADRRAAAAMVIGRSYVPPARRVAAWSRMAAELVNEGQNLAQIAEALCVSEDTARALLDNAQQGRVVA